MKATKYFIFMALAGSCLMNASDADPSQKSFAERMRMFGGGPAAASSSAQRPFASSSSATAADTNPAAGTGQVHAGGLSYTGFSGLSIEGSRAKQRLLTDTTSAIASHPEQREDIQDAVQHVKGNVGRQLAGGQAYEPSADLATHVRKIETEIKNLSFDEQLTVLKSVADSLAIRG